MSAQILNAAMAAWEKARASDPTSGVKERLGLVIEAIAPLLAAQPIEEARTLLTRAMEVCLEVVMRGEHASHNAANLKNRIDSYLQRAFNCGACPGDGSVCEGAFNPTQFNLIAHLERQREFSLRTFGPGKRTAGVCDHIRKELAEIEADPNDVAEWVDVILLALDGAWRAGFEPHEIAEALTAKQTKNEGRAWPDWRTADPNKAIEHDRSGEGECGVEGESPPVSPSVPLNPRTADLVKRFMRALSEKLAAAERKYGYSDNWALKDWREECQRQLLEHVAKGDPRDVAAYCMFAWHHGWPTVAAQPVAQPKFRHGIDKALAEKAEAAMDFGDALNPNAPHNMRRNRNV